MAERAGFEPDKEVNKHRGNDGKTVLGPRIGPLSTGTCWHCETQPVKEQLSGDLLEVIQAWPELRKELKTAVLAVVRSPC